MINKIGVLVFAGLICLDGATAPRKTSTAYSLSLFVTLRANKKFRPHFASLRLYKCKLLPQTLSEAQNISS